MYDGSYPSFFPQEHGVQCPVRDCAFDACSSRQVSAVTNLPAERPPSSIAPCSRKRLRQLYTRSFGSAQ